MDLSHTTHQQTRHRAVALFHVEVNGRVYELNDVKNVSAAGMEGYLPVAITTLTTARLFFTDNDMRIHMNANATTVGLNSQLGWRTFFKFQPKEPALNTLFFLAMRKYLDHFDAQRLAEDHGRHSHPPGATITNPP